MANAAEWKTLDLGSCSIELPSEWYVLDEQTREAIGRLANHPTKKHLLASQDKANQNDISMIVRVNTFPSSREEYEDMKNLKESDLPELTELLKEEYSKNKIIVLKQIFPVQKLVVEGLPTMLSSHLRQGKRGSEWWVRIFQIYTKNMQYQVTLSMDTQFPENAKVLDQIFSTFRILEK